MNDDRLTSLLGSLRHERMDRTADARARRRLEEAWAQRAARTTLGGRLRPLAPALAAFVLVVALGIAVMNASGDSPLYALRVAVEDAGVVLHPDRDDRARYLLTLLDQRQAEAARLEALGNALAAERVRTIERHTLEDLKALLPQEPEPTGAPSPAPTATSTVTPTPTPAPTVTATPTATATSGIGVPVPTPTRTAPFTARPTTAAPTPAPTVQPTATPAGTPFLLLVRGTVKDPDGTLNSGACVSMSPGGACITTVRADGTFDFTMSARMGQTVTVYAFTRDTGGAITTKQVASGTVKGTTLDLSMTLKPV